MCPPLATTPRQRRPRSWARPSSAAAASAARSARRGSRRSSSGADAAIVSTTTVCSPAATASQSGLSVPVTTTGRSSRRHASWRWFRAVFEPRTTSTSSAPGRADTGWWRSQPPGEAVTSATPSDSRSATAAAAARRSASPAPSTTNRRAAPACTRSASASGATTSAGSSVPQSAGEPSPSRAAPAARWRPPAHTRPASGNAGTATTTASSSRAPSSRPASSSAGAPRSVESMRCSKRAQPRSASRRAHSHAVARGPRGASRVRMSITTARGRKASGRSSARQTTSGSRPRSRSRAAEPRAPVRSSASTPICGARASANGLRATPARGNAVAREARLIARRALERRVVRDAGCQQRAADRDRGEGQQTAVGRAGRVLHEPDEVRPDEAAEVADRVDERDAGGGRGPAQQHGRHRPEHRVRAEQEEQPDRQRGDSGHRRDDRADGERDGGDHEADRDVALALARAVRAARDDDEPDDRDRVRDRGDEPLADLAQPADVVDDLADPERQPVDVDDHAEVQEPEREDAAVLQRLADGVALGAHPRALLALEPRREPALLVVLQPCGVGRPVVEVEEDEEAGEDGGHGLDEE